MDLETNATIGLARENSLTLGEERAGKLRGQDRSDLPLRHQ